jgi:hypothetical protein
MMAAAPIKPLIKLGAFKWWEDVITRVSRVVAGIPAVAREDMIRGTGVDIFYDIPGFWRTTSLSGLSLLQVSLCDNPEHRLHVPRGH